MSLERAVTTVGLAALVSRALGFVRDIVIATLLGAGAVADAFFLVLQLINVFRRLLAEGALNAAFIPMWLRIKAAYGADGASSFVAQVLGAMLLAVGALASIGLLLAPMIVGAFAPGFDAERNALAAEYLHAATPYVVMAGIVAVIAALLNAEGRVGAVALAIVAFNAVLLAALVWIAAFGPAQPAAKAAMLAHAIVLAGIGQLALTGTGYLRLRQRPSFPRFAVSAETRRFLSRAARVLLTAGIPQLQLIVGAMVASASPAAVSWLYYANRLYELPLGVAAMAVGAVLVPAMAAGVRSAEPGAIAAAQSRGLEIGLGLALPAAVAFAVLARPIAGALFERGAFGPSDTTAVAAALAAICVGLPGHVLEKVLGAVAFTHEDSRTPMLAAFAGLAAAFLGALALFPRYGHVGVAAAIALSGWIGAALLAAVLHTRGRLALDRTAARRLPRIILATAVMGVLLFAAQALAPVPNVSQPARIGALALLVAGGLLVYLASLTLLGVTRLRDLVAAVRGR